MSLKAFNEQGVVPDVIESAPAALANVRSTGTSGFSILRGVTPIRRSLPCHVHVLHIYCRWSGHRRNVSSGTCLHQLR